MKRCLVLGASGWMGSLFVEKMKGEANYLVEPVYRSNEFDPCNADRVLQLVRKHTPDLVINFCGVAGNDEALLEQVNVQISANILDAIEALESDTKLIALGSAAECGVCGEEQVDETFDCQPAAAYGVSKLKQTKLVLNHPTAKNGHLVLRPFNLIGAGMPNHILAGFLWEKFKKGDAEVFFPEMTRDFIEINDTVDAIVRFAKSSCEGGIYHLCSGEAVSVAALGQLMLEHCNIDKKVTQNVEMEDKQPPIPHATGNPTKTFEAIGWRARQDLRSIINTL